VEPLYPLSISGIGVNEQQLLVLKESVQRNCHISDARHGGDYGLCTYLLRMREYFRWEQGLGFIQPLDTDQVATWLEQREAFWEGLAGAEFGPVVLGEQEFDPFDTEAINRLLLPAGWVYSGGLGRSAKPHFFLAELERQAQLDGYSVYVAGRELARDLASPPAMSLAGSMFIRRESLRRMLWEKLESWRWHRPDNALGRAFSSYPFDQDTEAALDAMTEGEIELVILHERGECEAELFLGAAWQQMLADFAATPAELVARAVRDHLADCLSTLPALVKKAQPAALHFFIGNLGEMRKEIFPGLQAAYRQWHDRGDLSTLACLTEEGREHWRGVARRMLALHARYGADAVQLVIRLGEVCHL